jgi:HD superfamily phosphohydrolase
LLLVKEEIMPSEETGGDPGSNPYAYEEGTLGHSGKKILTLPISGSVTLWGPETEVIDTESFQRLAGIKQLGTSYVVFRGALHTRFEHSLGSLHQAERMIQAIRSNRANSPVVPDETARRMARLGSLLHDLPHVPFGHTLEDEFHLLDRHDENRSRISRLLTNGKIGRILRRRLPDGEFDLLKRILLAKEEEDFAALGEYAFVGDIVGNTLCADLLDYVERDLAACGLPVSLGDRFMDYLTVSDDHQGPAPDHNRIVLNVDKRGMPRPDVESEIIKLLSYRYELAERVYFHHAKNAASVMIGRAVQEAGFAVGPEGPPELDTNFVRLSDDLLLHALADLEIEAALGLWAVPDEGDRELAARLAKDVLHRRLYKIAYLAVHADLADGGVRRICQEYGRDPVQRRNVEDELAAAADLPPGSVLVHVPREKMMMKAALVRIRTSEGEILPLNDWDAHHSRRINALNQAHQGLWRLTVYVHPRHVAAAPIVRGKAQDLFRAPSRYVEKSTASAYSEEVFRQLSHRYGYSERDREDLFAEAARESSSIGLAATSAAMRRRIAENRRLRS